MKNSKLAKSLSFVCVLSMMLTACGTAKPSDKASGTASKEVAKEAPTKISWIIRSEEPKNAQPVLAKLNEITKEKINMELDMQFVSPGDYNDKMQMKMASGEEYDLCFTSSWANNYVQNAGKGAYLKLDDLIEKNAPDVWKTIPKNYWDGIKVNGSIYGFMNYQVMYNQAGMFMKKDVADELGIDATKIKTMSDITAMLNTVKSKKPEIYPIRGGGQFDLGVTLQDPAISMVSDTPYLAFDPATKKISNTLYFDKTKEAYQTMYDWKQKELQPVDAATLKDEDTLIKAGKVFSRYQRLKPGVEQALKAKYGFDVVVTELGGKVVNTSGVQSTITAVSSTSKHPEKAMQMYNFIFSDKSAFNTLIYGIEGQDYTKIDDTFIEKTKDTYSAPAWQLGNQFQAYLQKGEDPKVWENTIKGNQEATIDPLFGFVPDRAPVESELAACEAIWNEYKGILGYGLREPKETVTELMSKLDKAGLKKVTESFQTQVDTFFATK